ncbi:MAG TPA: alpha-1,4-glucan--maltose-1-phosphate maltosyltransferase [Beijerinckiaceae bacterium]|nr:alpha-1,4-glucan--maltose-1-phosphate maltosyltransferase [Beijerinckiaceae bacterium]
MARARVEENALISKPESARKSRPSQARAGAPPDPGGRVVIESVSPQVDCGRAAVKRVLGEAIVVTADIFTDGHETIAADLLHRADWENEWRRSPMRMLENDRWSGTFEAAQIGRHEYTIEAWRDPFASWAADTRKKRDAGANLSLELREGISIAQRGEAQGVRHPLRAFLRRLESARSESARLELLLCEQTRALMGEFGPREDVCRHAAVLPLWVDRPRARFSSWYELFPRSLSAIPGKSGTFDDVIAFLPYVRNLGFDVLYFPPIHPIGLTNRKGRNNALAAQKEDPGSVYAIGSAEGGHDAIHPELGDLDDFRRIVAAAKAQGIEIALDFAVQCSPDHPWIKQHPEWFDWRPDGSIKFAENPPKKYEDIVNVRFSGEAFPAVWIALRDVTLFWVEQGVSIFRVDNPHTKPVPFWRWLIDEIHAEHPQVIFLAEAFTRPKMMKELAKIGFQQSYTYFTWRHTKAELTDYVTELAGEMGEFYRPNFFVNTPDINPYFLQTSGEPGFFIRATLAATLSGNWGMYSGFELAESQALPGREEYFNSEKYEYKRRDFSAGDRLAAHITRLNDIRRENPALHDHRNVVFLNVWNDQIISYVKFNADRSNCIFVMVTLDPRYAQEASYELPLWEFGLPDHAGLEAEDLLLGIRFTMYGKLHRIRLDPAERTALVWRLSAPAQIGATA